MVRYQSNQNIQRKVGQKQLFPTKNANLRMNTLLKTRSQTTLRTNRTRETTRTKSSLKRKLLVYKKDGKYYIDNSAAYALKLTNVRAIMTENPHLVEVGAGTLSRLQSDKDIEIEYQELNKAKKDDLTKILGELEQGQYGIGIHGIDRGSSEKKQSVASSISNEGLNLNNNSKTILSTSISLGTNEDIQQISHQIMGYKYGNGTRVNVIIAAPLYIENENGERIFLGFPEQNKRTSGQQYMEHCILDQICGNLRKLPPEFILGYICEKQDGSDEFIKNERHYSNINQEEQHKLYQTVSKNMSGFSRDINSLISSGNLAQLENIRERMQKMNFPTYMIDNSIILAQRIVKDDNEKEEKTINSSQISSKRRVMLDNSQEEISDSSTLPKSKRRIIKDETKGETTTHSSINRSKRRILLDSYNNGGVRIEDLAKAKEILIEGIDPPDKSNEEKDNEYKN